MSYGLDALEQIDYEAMERLPREHRPKLIIAGGSAYALRIDFARFDAVAKDADLMVDMAHYAESIAAGVYSKPDPVCQRRHVHNSQKAACAARGIHLDAFGSNPEAGEQRGLSRASGDR